MLSHIRPFPLLVLIFCSLIHLPGQAQVFPEDWVGEWKGKLRIFQGPGETQQLPMELHIHPVDSSDNFSWTIIYGEDKEAGARNYQLEPIDPSQGLYRIDEKNSIVLEGYLIDSVFYQWFSVQGNLLLTRSQRIGPQVLVWEIVSGSLTPVSTTGGETIDGEEVPAVDAYPVRGVQKAVLTKVRE
jgi:hypothetical protein